MDIQCLGERHGRRFALYHGDCVSVMRQMPDECIDFSVYSPPFSSIFVYSDALADMGNVSSDDDFFEQYRFAVSEIHRLTLPGRLTAVHCSDLPLQKWKDGMIGMKDFSGRIIKAHEDCGWVTACRITIWKSPVVEMTRTKALGLLHKQLLKDSGRSRVGFPDYLIVFRKEGDNPKPISHTPESFPVSQWQEWASPVWMTVDQTNVLSNKGARGDKDERHLCPLQIDVAERAVTLWSNPGDVVLSPFAGIGTEGYAALRLERKFLGVELKPEYFNIACQELEGADKQMKLFSVAQ